MSTKRKIHRASAYNSYQTGELDLLPSSYCLGSDVEEVENAVFRSDFFNKKL